jgi:hypothetical protein
MSEQEADQLINDTAHRLGIRRLLTAEYKRELYRESDGHPYVIKILLGEIAKAGKFQKLERIISSRSDILEALFERTYAGLSPAAKLVFMTLSNWRSTVPELAVEAVMLRPKNEPFDVEAALDELKRSSFVEARQADDGNTFLTVPLVAGIFGKKKLAVSGEKSVVEANCEVLRFLGASQKTGIQHGIGPRIRSMFSQLTARIAKDAYALQEYLPVMEFVAHRYPPAWLMIASMFEEISVENSLQRAKDAVRRYLEDVPDTEQKRVGWKMLGEYCRRTEDWNGEIHALVGLAELPDATLEETSNAANRLNSLFASHQLSFGADKTWLIASLATAMEGRMVGASATDCSRLAWLYIRLHQLEKARSLVDRGLQLDPLHEYCQKLKDRLAQASSRGVATGLFP